MHRRPEVGHHGADANLDRVLVGAHGGKVLPSRHRASCVVAACAGGDLVPRIRGVTERFWFEMFPRDAGGSGEAGARKGHALIAVEAATLEADE